jgi:flagellar hook assembly protein FlgD
VPNPFDLKEKTVTLANGGATTSLTTEGTLIKVALPAGKAGQIRIEIFDLAGRLVRELTAAAGAGAYAYLPWDGRNDGGDEVASGVYLGRFTLNGGDEKFFKMAVVK